MKPALLFITIVFHAVATSISAILISICMMATGEAPRPQLQQALSCEVMPASLSG